MWIPGEERVSTILSKQIQFSEQTPAWLNRGWAGRSPPLLPQAAGRGAKAWNVTTPEILLLLVPSQGARTLRENCICKRTDQGGAPSWRSWKSWKLLPGPGHCLWRTEAWEMQAVAEEPPWQQSQNGQSWKGSWGWSHSTPWHGQRHLPLDQAAQSPCSWPGAVPGWGMEHGDRRTMQGLLWHTQHRRKHRTAVARGKSPTNPGERCHAQRARERSETTLLQGNGNTGSFRSKIYHGPIRSQSSIRQITQKGIYLSFYSSYFNCRNHTSNLSGSWSLAYYTVAVFGCKYLDQKVDLWEKKLNHEKTDAVPCAANLVIHTYLTGLIQCAILIDSAYKKISAKKPAVLFKVNLIPAYFKQIRNRLNLRTLLNHSALSYSLKVEIYMQKIHKQDRFCQHHLVKARCLDAEVFVPTKTKVSS